MEKSTFKRTPHPPYSPDLAPSDFYLFGTIKGKLRGQSFQTREALYEAINEKIYEISPSERMRVFDEWKERCQWVYEHKGLYFQK